MSDNNLLALLIAYVRAEGPVSFDDIANHLFEHDPVSATLAEARIYATLVVRRARDRGSIHTDESGTSFFA